MPVKIRHRTAAGEGMHWCPSCGAQKVYDRYRRCYSCQRKWNHVYQMCLNYGWPEDLAISKANDSYPEE